MVHRECLLRSSCSHVRDFNYVGFSNYAIGSYRNSESKYIQNLTFINTLIVNLFNKNLLYYTPWEERKSVEAVGCFIVGHVHSLMKTVLLYWCGHQEIHFINKIYSIPI